MAWGGSEEVRGGKEREVGLGPPRATIRVVAAVALSINPSTYLIPRNGRPRLNNLSLDALNELNVRIAPLPRQVRVFDLFIRIARRWLDLTSVLIISARTRARPPSRPTARPRTAAAAAAAAAISSMCHPLPRTAATATPPAASVASAGLAAALHGRISRLSPHVVEVTPIVAPVTPAHGRLCRITDAAPPPPRRGPVGRS